MNACGNPTWVAMRAFVVVACLGCAPPQRLCPEQQYAVEHQEEGGRGARGEDAAERVLEQQAEDAGRDWPTTRSQPSFASVSSAPMPRSRKLRPIPFTIRTQSARKKRSSTIAVARWVATRKVMK
jgi:hypothetical protein